MSGKISVNVSPLEPSESNDRCETPTKQHLRISLNAWRRHVPSRQCIRISTQVRCWRKKIDNIFSLLLLIISIDTVFMKIDMENMTKWFFSRVWFAVSPELFVYINFHCVFIRGRVTKDLIFWLTHEAIRSRTFTSWHLFAQIYWISHKIKYITNQTRISVLTLTNLNFESHPECVCAIDKIFR